MICCAFNEKKLTDFLDLAGKSKIFYLPYSRIFMKKSCKSSFETVHVVCSKNNTGRNKQTGFNGPLIVGLVSLRGGGGYRKVKQVNTKKYHGVIL
jgi:hypothetical protein